MKPQKNGTRYLKLRKMNETDRRILWGLAAAGIATLAYTLVDYAINGRITESGNLAFDFFTGIMAVGFLNAILYIHKHH